MRGVLWIGVAFIILAINGVCDHANIALVLRFVLVFGFLELVRRSLSGGGFLLFLFGQIFCVRLTGEEDCFAVRGPGWISGAFR